MSGLEAYFSVEGERIIPSIHGAGPWDPTVLHGGAPAGLIAYLAEQAPTPRPMNITRLTIDLKRPVPIAPLSVDREVTREGRNIQTLAITLSAGGKEVVSASVLKVGARDLELPQDAHVEPLVHAGPDTGERLFEFERAAGFSQLIEIREVPRQAGSIGGRACWFNVSRPFIPDTENTPVMRAAASADYCNALGVPLDFRTWTYINADLTVHFSRQPEGTWILLDGEAMIGADGRGLAYASLSDERGRFGRAIQSLVVAPR